MITYIKDNDIKKFNTYALSLRKKQKERAYSLLTVVSYFNNVYNTYCVYYNALVKLQKDVDELTKENLFTKKKYSSYNKVDVTTSFNVSVDNVRLVKENTTYKYKSTIDDLSRGLLDLNLTVKELTANIVTGLDVYGEMRRSTSRIINDCNESISQVQTQTNIALRTGEITPEEYTEMKETAESDKRSPLEKALAIENGEEARDFMAQATEDSEEAERAREEAERAARQVFEQEQTRLNEEAKRAQNAANEANSMYDNYSGTFGEHYNSSDGVSSYTDPLTDQSWTKDVNPYLESYTYSNGTNSVTLEVDTNTGEVSYKGTTYDNWEQAAAAANNDLGKEAISTDQTSFFEKAEETYNDSKTTAAENKNQADAKADAAADAAKEHESSGSNESSSGGI